MFKCTLPNDHTLKNIEPAFDQLSPIDPVVIFLDVEKVRNHIVINQAAQNISGPRIESINDMLDNGIFSLPIIYSADGVIKLSQGRHRTSAMWHRSEPVMPFLTAKVMANEILSTFGTLASKKDFDLSLIPYPCVT